MSTNAAPDGRLRVASFGVTLELICADAEILPRAVEALPPGWTIAPPDVRAAVTIELSRPAIGARRPVTLRVDGVVRATALRVATVIDLLEVAVREEVARRSPTMLFVHAGVVAIADHAIVVPGASASGKTTLVSALLAAGAEYGSDDYAVIDGEGLVHPYPRRLSVRQGPHRRQRLSAAEVAGAPVMPAPLPIGLLVFTEYHADAQWSPSQLSAGQAAMALLAHTLAARDRPADALRILANATNRAVALAGPRGDASDSAVRILAAARAAIQHAAEAPE